RRHMQRAERAGGYGDRLPAHHMRAAALSGPVEGGGVLSPLLPIIPAISPEIRMAGCGPTLKTSARGDSSPDARLPVRICRTPLLPGSLPAKLTSNQYSVESPARSDPTTARRNFPTPELPVPSNDAH